MPENIQMICLVRLIVAVVCGLLIGVERREKMQVTEPAVGLTDGKATLCVCTTGWSRKKSPCARSISSVRRAIR